MGQLLESLSSKDSATLLKEKVFTPLNMARTSLFWNLSDSNEAKSYGIPFDQSPVEIARPFRDISLMMKTAGGIKSSLNDVMSFYEVWMKSVIAQFDGSTDSTPRSPFKHCRKIASHHASFEGSSLRE